MASRVIFDTPELLDETLVSLTEACRCFPVKCSRAALERWMRRQGNRGIVLESILVCGKRYTSKEAIPYSQWANVVGGNLKWLHR